ncbi:hypothetical protein ABL840_19135 [Variovorax sp. NFACC27]|uniref:hypothetical protein n=1 Tax=unclassified Variovorax TaxID=663243 RepID=UPI00115FFA8D
MTARQELEVAERSSCNGISRSPGCFCGCLPSQITSAAASTKWIRLARHGAPYSRAFSINISPEAVALTQRLPVKLSQPRGSAAITSKNELVNVNFDMNKKPQTKNQKSR